MVLAAAQAPLRLLVAIASLQTYVLVSQTPPLVEVYRRSGDMWQYEAAGPGQRLLLDHDGLSLDVDALYRSGLAD